MKLAIKQAVAALSLSMAGNAVAEDPTWFEVEVLVFTQNQQSSERWPDTQTAVNTGNSIDLFKSVWMPDISHYQLALDGCSSEQWFIDPQGCEQKEQQQHPHAPSQLPKLAVEQELGDPLLGNPYLLPEALLQFSDQSKQLRRNGNEILLHSGWQMPIYGKRAAKGIHIYGGKNYQDEYQSNGELQPDQSEVDPFAWLDSVEQQPQPLWQLDGKITIYLNRFLYIQPHLTLRKPALREVEILEPQPAPLSVDSGVQIYAIDDQPQPAEEVSQQPYLASIEMEQNRRVRSREIHYFDHPEFGVVIQIRRMEQPVVPIQEEPPVVIESATTTN